MNPSRLEGVWIDLQVGDGGAEGGGTLAALPRGAGTRSRSALPGECSVKLPPFSGPTEALFSPFQKIHVSES